MKLYRFALNIWITIASLLSFLLGWVILAHAPKPVQSVQPVQSSVSSPAMSVLPTLEPLQFGSSGGSSFQNFQVQIPAPATTFSNPAPAPVFRTSGS